MAANNLHLARVQKLHNDGKKYNDCLLKLKGNVLSYYEQIPKDFDRTLYFTLASNPKVPDKKQPRAQINIKPEQASVVTAGDIVKYAVLDKDKSFKVVFTPKEIIGRERVSSPTTWYFTLTSKEERNLWVIHTMSCRLSC